MFTNGQMINYEKYLDSLQSMPAPILGDQLPEIELDLPGLMAYAHSKGVKAGELSEEEKNRFIKGGTVTSLRRELEENIQYRNVVEWNAAHDKMAAIV